MKNLKKEEIDELNSLFILEKAYRMIGERYEKFAKNYMNSRQKSIESDKFDIISNRHTQTLERIEEIVLNED